MLVCEGGEIGFGVGVGDDVFGQCYGLCFLFGRCGDDQFGQGYGGDVWCFDDFLYFLIDFGI